MYSLLFLLLYHKNILLTVKTMYDHRISQPVNWYERQSSARLESNIRKETELKLTHHGKGYTMWEGQGGNLDQMEAAWKPKPEAAARKCKQTIEEKDIQWPLLLTFNNCKAVWNVAH